MQCWGGGKKDTHSLIESRFERRERTVGSQSLCECAGTLFRGGEGWTAMLDFEVVVVVVMVLLLLPLASWWFGCS